LSGRHRRAIRRRHRQGRESRCGQAPNRRRRPNAVLAIDEQGHCQRCTSMTPGRRCRGPGGTRAGHREHRLRPGERTDRPGQWAAVDL